MKKWNVLSCFKFWIEAISLCYHNTHLWPGAQQTVYVCVTIHLLFSRTLSLGLQGRERGHVWASLLLKHKKDVVSALFSLSCPRKLPVDPPVVVSGLVPIADPHMKSFFTWMSHQMKHEANTCDSASGLLLHSLTLSCIATDWDVNQGKWRNLVEGLTDSLLCDMMWFPRCLCLTCRTEVWTWPLP